MRKGIEINTFCNYNRSYKNLIWRNNTMGKKELVAAVAAKTGLTKKDAKAAVEAFVSAVTETVASGEKVSLVGFGTFAPKERAERKGHNPRTGESLTIAAKTVPTFKAGAAFKNSVAK